MNKRRFFQILLAILVIAIVSLIASVACALPPEAQRVENPLVQDYQSKPAAFTSYLGDIGNGAKYSLWVLDKDEDKCYIVLDEHINESGNSNAAPAITCKFGP
jgi:hypothetical protein